MPQTYRKRAFAALALFVALAVVAGRVRRRARTRRSRSRPSRRRPRQRTRRGGVPVAPLTGLPDPTDVARKRPAVTVKINNTNAAQAVRHRPGRRRLRRGRRGRHHAARRDLQLAGARPRRPGALGAQDRPEHRVADRRHLRLLGRRAVRDRQHQHRAGEAARRDARRLDDVPRPRQRRGTRRSTCGRTSTRCSRPAARRSRRRRCSSYRKPRRAGRRDAGRGGHVGFAAGFDDARGRGTRRAARGCASKFGAPDVDARRTCGSRRRTSS